MVGLAIASARSAPRHPRPWRDVSLWLRRARWRLGEPFVRRSIPEAMRMFGSNFIVRIEYAAAALECRTATCRQNCASRGVSADSSISMVSITRIWSAAALSILWRASRKRFNIFRSSARGRMVRRAGNSFLFHDGFARRGDPRENDRDLDPDPSRRRPVATPRGQAFAFDKSRLGNTHMWVDPNMPTEGP